MNENVGFVAVALEPVSIDRPLPRSKKESGFIMYRSALAIYLSGNKYSARIGCITLTDKVDPHRRSRRDGEE